MKPFYETKSVKLYHGDCLELLPTLANGSIDCTMTSPPYNTLPDVYRPRGFRRTSDKWILKAVNGYKDRQPSELIYQHWLQLILAHCLRLTNGVVWVNHKVRYRDRLAVHPVRFLEFPLFAEIVWDKRGSLAVNSKRFMPSHEVLLGFGEPTYWHDASNKFMSVWKIPNDWKCDDDDHPCKFPVELARRPIEASCRPRGTVLDPFAGSGTTGVAALNLYRNFIGVEKEEKWCELAAKRLEQAERLANDEGTLAVRDVAKMLSVCKLSA